MKITDIKTYLMDCAPPEKGGWSARNWLFVKVETDEGVYGIGEASGWPRVVETAIRDLTPLILGEDPCHIEKIWSKMLAAIMGHGMTGVVGAGAMTGIEIALWDIKGKVANLPVVELLGGKFRDRVAVYTHFYGATPEESAAQARRLVEAGYTALKSGALSSDGYRFDPYEDDGRPVETAAHYAAVREAVGPDVKLLIDCHGRFTVANCVRLARALEPYDLYAFEDPVPPEDLSAYPKVRREISIPVMGSERLNTKSHFRQLLDIDGIDIAQPDLMYAGGITEVRKIAAIADTFHVPISPHNTKGPVGIIAATHMMASIPNVALMEFVTGIEWRDEIIAEPLRVEDSCIVLPEGPGWGVELDLEGVEKYRWRVGDSR